MTKSTKRLRPLERRVAIWLSAASLLGLLVLALAVMGAIALEEREEASEALLDSEAPEGDSILEEASESVFWAILIAMPVSVGLSVAGAFAISRRAFAPLHEVTQAVGEIGAHDLAARITATPQDLDLERLVAAFNSLLGRLETSSKALDRYASEVSHELRTPLAVAILELEVSLRHPRDQQQWEATGKTTLTELRLLAQLVNSLLSLARMQDLPGGQRERFYVVQAMETIAIRARHVAAEKAITLNWNSSELATAFELDGASDLVSTGLWNLVSNALEHTPPGGLVSVSFEVEALSTIVLQVDDNGPGLAPNALSWQAAAGPDALKGSPDTAIAGDRVKHKQGLGLGLPLTERIARAHGGHLQATTSKLGGACFQLSLRNERVAPVEEDS